MMPDRSGTADSTRPRRSGAALPGHDRRDQRIITSDHGQDDDEQRREPPPDADDQLPHISDGHRSAARIAASRVGAAAGAAPPTSPALPRSRVGAKHA